MDLQELTAILNKVNVFIEYLNEYADDIRSIAAAEDGDEEKRDQLEFACDNILDAATNLTDAAAYIKRAL